MVQVSFARRGKELDMNGGMEEAKTNLSPQTQAAAEELKAGAAKMTERGQRAAGKLAAALDTARARVQER
jgi:hypothetical protein